MVKKVYAGSILSFIYLWWGIIFRSSQNSDSKEILEVEK